MKNYLPIGSVVLLKEADKRIMIIGLAQKEAETETVWDYSAVLYPEGLLDPSKLYLFNHDKLQTIFFIGFQDPEGIQFLSDISNPSESSNIGQGEL